MGDLQEFKITETFGMGVANPGSAMRITGDPEVLQAIYDYLVKLHPEWVDDRKTE